MSLSECDKFPGRLKDICLGRGMDGRRNPSLDVTNRFRAENGLPELSNAEVAAADHEKSGTAQVPLTTWQQAKSVAKAGVDLIKRAGRTASPEQVSERLAICQACDQYQAGGCKLCGCQCNGKPGDITNKLTHLDATCPHKPPKWGPIE